MIYLFVLQIIFAILLIAIVLLQSSDEDALSGIGGSIGNSSILSHKSSVDLVTKVTIILGCCLIANSLALTVISKNRYSRHETIIEDYLKKQGKHLNSKTELEDKKNGETEKDKIIKEIEKDIENEIIENSEENKEENQEKEVINNEVTVEQNIENENIQENNNKVVNKEATENTNE